MLKPVHHLVVHACLRLIELHINTMPLPREMRLVERPTPEEQAYFDDLTVFLKEETGYQWIQGTRRQTLAYALMDLPVGLAAWIAEKLQRWSECEGDPEAAIPLDLMLANISLYWFTGCTGASFFPYWARIHRASPIPAATRSRCRLAMPPSRPRSSGLPARWLSGQYQDIRRWTVMKRGGHSAAMEQHEALAREVLEFLRPLRR